MRQSFPPPHGFCEVCLEWDREPQKGEGLLKGPEQVNGWLGLVPCPELQCGAGRGGAEPWAASPFRLTFTSSTEGRGSPC